MVIEVPQTERVNDVDVFLSTQDGQIQRPKGPNCRHPVRQKCTNCLPVDPFDEEYLKEKDIKHMSFHAHVRKLLGSQGKGTTLKKPLENFRCSLKPNCDAHKPFPKGICTKCKPQVVTLNRQKFRHVDNIQIENQELVNQFLDYWRLSVLVLSLFLPFSHCISTMNSNWKDIFDPKPLHDLSEKCLNDTDTWLKSLEIFSTVSVECLTLNNCTTQESKILDENLYAVKQLDAFGEFPTPGLLELRTLYDGSYQECDRIDGERYKTNYCYLILNFGKNISCSAPSVYSNVTLRMAVCLPDSCSHQDMINIFNQLSPYPFTACDAYCVKNTVEKDVPFWGFTVFLTIVIAVAIFATLLDYVQDAVLGLSNLKEKNIFIKIILTFSLWTNAELILSVKEHKPGFIKSLDCIRGLSIFWVITGHSFIYMTQADTMKPVMEFQNQFWNHLIINAPVSVDSFFALSGIVVAYLFFKMKPNIKMAASPVTWILFYVHRYLRLTPTVMIFIGFFTVYFPYVQGPFAASFSNVQFPQVEACKDYWWHNLLYINNFDNSQHRERNTCYAITWYLAVDTQLYILAPIVLIALFFSFAVGTAIIVAGCVGSIIATYILFDLYDVPADPLGNGDHRYFFGIGYSKPWIRCPPYLVGLLTGYLLATYGTRRIRLNWAVSIGVWIVAFVVAGFCIFSTYDYDKGEQWSTFSRATFFNFHRLGWGVFVCWVVGANHMGWGGPIDTFMSHPIWQPFGRLSYCAYIVHWMVLYFYLNVGGALHYTSAWHVFLYISIPATVLSFVFAFFWSCLFEMPILKLEKMLIESLVGRSQMPPAKTSLKEKITEETEASYEDMETGKIQSCKL